MFETICSRLRDCRKEALEPVLELAIEIAREGREGRRIGTLFTVGDEQAVLAHSRPLILDPLVGHSPELRLVTHPDLRGTVKELAQLDGAFVVSDEGLFVAACRYLDATAGGVDLPLGLGSRHFAAASISRVTSALGIAVSESSTVRVFEAGALVAEIIPELWLLSRHIVQLRGPIRMEHLRDFAVLTQEREEP
jgi:DNA integrity scanning protein DisA with diadenylate cyclase activity